MDYIVARKTLFKMTNMDYAPVPPPNSYAVALHDFSVVLRVINNYWLPITP